MSRPVIFNPGGAIRPAPLIEPLSTGYLLITATVDPPDRPGPAGPSKLRTALLDQVADLGRTLCAARPGCQVQVFRAVGFPPFQALQIPERHQDLIGRYDVVVLVTTDILDELVPVEEHEAYRTLLAAMRGHSRTLTVTKARNVRRIATTPPTDKLHLFNFFLTEDEPKGLEVWEYLAGWYHQEMNMRDSEVLLPIEPENTPFAFVNHASWNMALPAFITRQMTRRSFRSFVIGNLSANEIGSLPFLYCSHWIS